MADCRDQINHCPRIKAMNLCRVYRYKYQCCQTCQGGMEWEWLGTHQLNLITGAFGRAHSLNAALAASHRVKFLSRSDDRAPGNTVCAQRQRKSAGRIEMCALTLTRNKKYETTGQKCAWTFLICLVCKAGEKESNMYMGYLLHWYNCYPNIFKYQKIKKWNVAVLAIPKDAISGKKKCWSRMHVTFLQ